MNLKRSPSIYSKGLIATDEQDQEQGPWFTASDLSGTVVANDVCFTRKQERNKTQTLTRVTAAN
jgi:hypothetical protein